MTTFLSHLECAYCGKIYSADEVHNLCSECSKPLLVRYDLDSARAALTREAPAGRVTSMWRYREVLPVRDDANIVTMGEGWTPILPMQRLGPEIGLDNLFVKDEGQIPTGSFKARGLGMAVSKAKEFGIRKIAIPSAGNAAGALACYGARAGMQVYIFMPKDAPEINKKESHLAGARVTLVDGLITDCGKIVGGGKETVGWFDVSTLKEPYRIEGKKTMGYELAEQFGWKLPDVILYPTGGGTGLVGMWKAFDEMEALGWIGSERPRMVSVQSTGCAPIVRAFENGDEFAEPFAGAQTFAAGIRVPAAVGDFIMLRLLRASHGTAIAVPDAEIAEGMSRLAKTEGIFACPEGGATIAAVKRLRESGFLKQSDRVLCFNTGTGIKYPESVSGEWPILDPRAAVDYSQFME